MAVFEPFRAYRPVRQKAAEVSCKPYDVVNTEEARTESSGNKESFYRVIKPEIDFPQGQDPFAPEVYKRGKENLEHLIDEGVLVQEDTESYYVYELRMGDHRQTGLVGCCSIDDYFNNVIKRHELTKPKIEDDRKKHITVSKFNYEPVFFSYRNVPAIDATVNSAKNASPLYQFTTMDGIEHTMWRITDAEKIAQIKELFQKEVPVIYIADGHHRTAAGAKAGKELKEAANGSNGHRYSYLMSVVFPENQVQILDYNRVVKDLHGLSPEEFIARVSEKFEIEKSDVQYAPKSHTEIGMYLNDQWYKLTARPGTFEEGSVQGELGFTILSNNILEPILNIVDLRNDDRIEFIGGIRGLSELQKMVDNGSMKVAFAVHPIDMNKLMEISDLGQIMPPKVTWFEPKLRSGLVVHQLSAQ